MLQGTAIFHPNVNHVQPDGTMHVCTSCTCVLWLLMLHSLVAQPGCHDVRQPNSHPLTGDDESSINEATLQQAALCPAVVCTTQAVDFSRDILSLMHGELHIAAYPFHGYWEDVGSLKDYYAANMAMAADVSGVVGEISDT